MKDADKKSIGPPMNTGRGEAPVEVDAQPITSDGRHVYKIDPAPSEAIVIHCADPRFQNAFQRFITEELGLKTYTPITVGGGIHALSSQSFMPKNFKILWEQIKFFVKLNDTRRIIFINHEDCKWYEKMHGHLPRLNLPAKGMEDLETAAQVILEDFAGVHLETYFAHLNGDEVTFERLS